MHSDYGKFIVSSKTEQVLATVAISEHLGAVVATILPGYCELYVDTLDLLGDNTPASWFVTIDSTIGVPIWRRLGEDDAQRRAGIWRALLAYREGLRHAAALLRPSPASADDDLTRRLYGKGLIQ